MNIMPSLQFWGAATVGARGQIVIPREARERLGICEGDKLVVMSTPDNRGAVLFKADVFESTMLEMSKQFAGIVKESKQENGEVA